MTEVLVEESRSPCPGVRPGLTVTIEVLTVELELELVLFLFLFVTVPVVAAGLLLDKDIVRPWPGPLSLLLSKGPWR